MLLRRKAVETARVPVLKRESRAQGALLSYFTHQLGYVDFHGAGFQAPSLPHRI
jgi:hypothetical protein